MAEALSEGVAGNRTCMAGGGCGLECQPAIPQP